MVAGTELEVAVVCENIASDGAILARIVELVLDRPVRRWEGDGIQVTKGWKGVYRLARPLLQRAADDGVQHAVVSVDNDGGAKRRPLHAPDHEPPIGTEIEVLVDDKRTCRWCVLRAALPEELPLAVCLAVPLQTLEAWLLAARGGLDDDERLEAIYQRSQLKKRCWGRPMPPDEDRQAMALEWLSEPGVLDRLRRCASFGLFERCLLTWLD